MDETGVAASGSRASDKSNSLTPSGVGSILDPVTTEEPFVDISLYDIGISYICLLFALCVHEAAHALVADWRGDPSPRFMGRVTLNPLSHIDPIGTVVMPLLMMFTGAGFLLGWARPVQFNPVNLKNMRRDPVWIAVAGPASNLLLALASVVVLRVTVTFMGVDPVLASPLGDVLLQLMLINAVLLLFNMLPIPPLDGHHVLHYFLPPRGQEILEKIGPFGILIALVIVFNTRILEPPLNALVTAMGYMALGGAS
jgi:Zn-dependent protease